MYYVGPDGQTRDDGWGDWTNAYGVEDDGTQYHLDPELASELTQRWYAEHAPPAIGGFSPGQVAEIRSRFPIGDVFSKITGALGIDECAPCARRKAALNAFGDRVAGAFRSRHG